MLVWRVFVVSFVVESLLLLCNTAFTPGISWQSWSRPAWLRWWRISLLNFGGKHTVDAEGKRLLRWRKGVKPQRLLERKTYKQCLPSLIMGNVRSLGNKIDELTVLTRSHQEYWECSLMIFSESWLHTYAADHNVSTEGFHTVWADRDCTESGKCKGGGLAVYLNNRWCNPGHMTVKDCICSLATQLLGVGLRPYYLPHEFSHAIVVAVYIPPSANPTSAGDIIHSAIARLQTAHPSALIIILGDFDHVFIKKTLPKFTQYVTCKTSEKTLDLLYANVKDAYTSTSLPPLGRSDHNFCASLLWYGGHPASFLCQRCRSLIVSRTTDWWHWRHISWRPWRDLSWISSRLWSGRTWIPSSSSTSPRLELRMPSPTCWTVFMPT